MKTLPNSMAYPLSTPNGRTDDGLSKREHFAALFMQALIASGNSYGADQSAVKLADHFIQELNKDN